MSDLFDMDESSSGGSSMEKLVAMATEIVETEELIESLEENLAELKKRQNQRKTVELPDAMAEVGLSTFSLSSGFTIKVEEFVSGSLPKDEFRRDAAISWLSENGAEALIKTEVNLTFAKSEHNRALSLISELSDKGYNVSAKNGIHPQTLIAHIRERLKSGEEVPLDLLGLYAGRVAKIKPPRK
jgi:hypothetical protein